MGPIPASEKALERAGKDAIAVALPLREDRARAEQKRAEEADNNELFHENLR